VLTLGTLKLDPAARTVTLGLRPIELQAREFNLLHELMRNAGRVLTRRELEQRLYAWGEEIESNALEVHVHHLRRKLAPALIRTVRGVGYVIPRDALRS
jgi:DNA-binding response OmpR family regulator